ncbi:MAG: N-methyl-L-tryptophan oxidase [Phycisphaerales bacterium]
MPDRFDVIVLGVGAMGASACYHLALRGAAVLGLEQFDIPNDQGSAHGQSRAFRMCYFEHPDYVPLLRRSLELWHELEEITERKLLHMTGGIWFGPAECELIAGSRDAGVTHNVTHEWIEHDELAKRYPQFTVPDEYVGFYEPQAGLLLPERIISACAEHAAKRGAVLRANEPVVKWRADAQVVTVETIQGTYEADHLVVCAGPWSDRIIGDLGVPLSVTRQIAIWVQPKRPERFALGMMPIWAIDRPSGGESGAGGMYYGFPILPDKPGFKLSVHCPGPSTDPDTIDRTAQPNETNELREILGRFIPEADGPLLEASVCMYTNTPDAHFIVDHHPQHANVTIGTGFSGHGFKFASVIGEALADLTLTGRTELPIGFLGLGRFVSSREDPR